MYPDNISPVVVEKWLTGWSMSRGLPLPVRYDTGFSVDVGWPEQQRRYVFPALTGDIIRLADAIHDHWVFLKVCAPPDALKDILPSRWEIQPQGYMMTMADPMPAGAIRLPHGYYIETDMQQTHNLVKILTGEGNLAASGRIIFVDDLAIYDRISTEAAHRRKGLGTIVMKTLESVATANGYTKSILVATEEGQMLYTSLGWKLYSLYTSAVIPGPVTDPQ
ncbi:MAG TPA: GNAT family N-acetyltransferase [Chitinophaga sp.]|uniref:GNAT family N-acetyltransferase n=1 Tax=Chitinophaga sp. TaxID=1869181 RepID=UPI002B51F52A|nr:GNAT family N-acetyltransferase [Chitinophaga sp.]HVI46838.1 GNAT family N-acetyltransferase [Chitinophaga sp.]